jgi:glycerol kinase
MGDQQAALYGQGCFKPGTIKNTYGTGCFMLLNTGRKCIYSKKGLLTTLGCDAKGNSVYVLEGSVFIAGAVIQWLRDELKMIKDSSSSEAMALKVNDTNGVYVVPAFVGLGAPYWNAQARGIITGLTRGVNVSHIVRAALESMAYQTKQVFDLMRQESGLAIMSLAVDGGACRNNFLMQFQSDLLFIPINRPLMVDSTAAGAAYLAGVSIGWWKPEGLRKIKIIERTFRPCLSRKESLLKYDGWCHAVRQALA